MGGEQPYIKSGHISFRLEKEAEYVVLQSIGYKFIGREFVKWKRMQKHQDDKTHSFQAPF